MVIYQSGQMEKRKGKLLNKIVYQEIVRGLSLPLKTVLKNIMNQTIAKLESLQEMLVQEEEETAEADIPIDRFSFSKDDSTPCTLR